MNYSLIYVLADRWIHRQLHSKTYKHETEREELGTNCITHKSHSIKYTDSDFLFHTSTLTQAYTLDIKIVQDQATAFYF